MPQSFVSLHYHLIFSTKNRLPLIKPALQPRLFEYMGGVIRNFEGVLLAAGGMPDHVHLLASVNKTQSVADALRTIKANSSGWLHETFPGHADFAWQTGYAAFAVSHSRLESVREYLLRQEEHHRPTTFEDEYRSFLNRHNIEFNERYLWD